MMSVPIFDNPEDGTFLDLNAQVPPWGATVNGALSLLPDAVLLGQEPSANGANRGVSRLRAYAWVEELSGQVALRLDGWSTLSADLNDDTQLSDRDNLKTSARSLVHNGVASYIQAARYSGDDRSGYATILWERYTTGLDVLTGWLTRRLEGEDPAAQDGGAIGGAVGRFPPPFYRDQMRF